MMDIGFKSNGPVEQVESIARAVVHLLWKNRDEPQGQEVVFRHSRHGQHGQYAIFKSHIEEIPVPLCRGLDMSKETCLVAGGAGGLGRELVKFLMERGAKVTAVGRSAKGNTSTLISGAEYVQVDISEFAALQKVVERVKPTSILHLAGVLKDGQLKDLTWEDFEGVLKPKVYGAQHLHDLSADARTFVMFSSMASMLPFPQQMNHAAANAVLDALAHERRFNKLPGLAIN